MKIRGLIVKIEKNIPVPSFLKSNKWEFLQNMEVGDSVCDEEAGAVSTTESKMYNSLKRIARKNGWKIAGQKEPEGGIRLWRVK